MKNYETYTSGINKNDVIIANIERTKKRTIGELVIDHNSFDIFIIVGKNNEEGFLRAIFLGEYMTGDERLILDIDEKMGVSELNPYIFALFSDYDEEGLQNIYQNLSTEELTEIDNKVKQYGIDIFEIAKRYRINKKTNEFNL